MRSENVTVTLFDPAECAWRVEAVAARATAADLLGSARGCLVWLPGTSWTVVPVRLAASGPVMVAAAALPPEADWAAVAALSQRVLDDDTDGAPSHAVCAAAWEALIPPPERVPERCERIAVRLVAEWANSPNEAAHVWDALTERQRAPWRRRALMFARLADADASGDPDAPARALAFAWMTDPDNRMAAKWLSYGGWNGEPEPRRDLWRARAALAYEAPGPAPGSVGPRPR